VDPLKTDTASIADPHLKSAFIGLLNLVDILSSENEELKVENQPLKNEVNILKGELGKPTIKPKSSKNKDASAEEAPKDTNISAEKERKEDSNDNNNSESQNTKKQKRIRQSKLAEIHVDREHLCEIDRATLPLDAVNKGYSDIVIQDINIVTDNVRYRRETDDSPSLGNTFLAPLPPDVAGQGEFGLGIRSLIPLFKSACHLSESAMLSFFHNVGLCLSATDISNQWTKGYDFFNQEKSDVMIAGIGSGTYQQIDDTFARVNGANHYPPILCDQYYAAFFTTERNDRLTVLDIFRHFAPRAFLYDDYATTLLAAFKMPQKDRKQINIHVEKNKAVDEACFEGWLSSTGK
jgi:Skp family chaperone for outer membrane proteins